MLTSQLSQHSFLVHYQSVSFTAILTRGYGKLWDDYQGYEWDFTVPLLPPDVTDMIHLFMYDWDGDLNSDITITADDLFQYKELI